MIERFPIGRRLAFDGVKGRLWVVCRKCGGWNLTPLEERWEAIEECERRFRGTVLRASTDHIGMTKLPEGLELIRIGDPLRPELAAWRYGDRLVRRRWRAAGLTAIGIGLIGGELALVRSLALVGVSVAGWMNLQTVLTQYWMHVRTAVRVSGNDGERINVTISQALRVDIEPSYDDAGWTLNIPARSFKPWGRGQSAAQLTGPAALRAAGLIFPRINGWGATRTNIAAASALLQQRGVEQLYRDAAKRAVRIQAAQPGVLRKDMPLSLLHEHQGREIVAQEKAKAGAGSTVLAALAGPPRHLGVLAPQWRLALEIGAHEESERRAMEGELAELEAAWREAEEIAAIADNMFLPQSIRDFLTHHHRGP